MGPRALYHRDGQQIRQLDQQPEGRRVAGGSGDKTIRIWAVDREMSLATITHACDSVQLNDYLEPFVLPEEPAISVLRPRAQRGNYGRLLTGNDNRTIFGRGDYFLVDRGSDHGVSVGAQFVVYRDKRRDENFLFELGEAVAVVTARHPLGTIPRPPFWSGFRVAPIAIEFWHDRPFRLHDRIAFTRSHPNEPWTKTRLYP